jgi:hypothetical protein
MPRYPDPNPLDPNDPRRRDPLNPRDPRGGGGSELNPTRDHVQGEPEGTTPDANEHEPPTPSSPPSEPPFPASRTEKPDPYYYDPTKP